jgi:2-polyprenyl-3-methyl-5-hydroxy-6-metoxy-1,4-benzoquinol methylase
MGPTHDQGGVAVPAAIDADKLKLFSFQVFTKLEGAVTAGMIHLGDRLGLFGTMADGARRSSAELARDAGLDERWVREWLHNQAAARIVSFEETAEGERFWLTPEAVAVLATPSHPAYGMGMFHRLPNTMQLLRDLPESFRTGVGYDYDAHGPEGAAGIERSFEPWYRNFLLPVGLPALDGMVARLEAGATVADVGCGAGVAIRLMAKAFPHSQFHGYDISELALERAESRRQEDGLDNAHFHNVRYQPLPEDGRFDLITTFDCIHDMTHPQEMMHAIRKAISPEGTWLLVDIKAQDTFGQNVEKNPMASLMYGISVMSCMSSALSEPGGAGLGTLGLSEARAREMAEAAGFTRFRKLEVDHAVNSFFEVRP